LENYQLLHERQSEIGSALSCQRMLELAFLFLFITGSIVRSANALVFKLLRGRF